MKVAPIAPSARLTAVFAALATCSASISGCDGTSRVHVEVVTEVYDVNDWHPGLAASGPDTQVAGFRDDWAAWLADEGAACEFEMGVTYREWVARPTDPHCGASPPPDEPRE